MEPLTFIAASISLLATPGPTNTLLATSGAAIGVRRSLPLLAAELAGYMAAITGLHVVIGPVIAGLPVIEVVLRVAVACYLLYLALRLWQHAAHELGAKGPITFGRVLLTTLLNPKAVIFTFSLLPQGTSFPSLLPWLAALGVLIVAVGSAWIALGTSLRRRFEGAVPSYVGYRVSAGALALLAGVVTAHVFR